MSPAPVEATYPADPDVLFEKLCKSPETGHSGTMTYQWLLCDDCKPGKPPVWRNRANRK